MKWVYAALAVIGAIGTWWCNVLSITGHENYLAGWFASPASSSAAVDIIVVATACCVFFVVEGRRLGMRHTWVLIPFTFIVAAAFTVPLFFAWREHALSRHRSASGASIAPLGE